MIYINAKFLTQKVTGVQRFAIEICKGLIKIEPNIVLLTPRKVINEELYPEFKIVSCGINKGNLWEQIDLPIFLNKRGTPLLLNLTNSAPLLYKNKIITIHDVAFEQDPSWFSFKFRTFYKFLIPKNIKRSKLTFTVSNFSNNEIIKYYKIKHSKIKVVFNFFNKNIFSINLNNNKY